MTSYTFEDQIPVLSSEGYFEEAVRLVKQPMTVIVLSSVLIHLALILLAVIWLPRFNFNLTPPEPPALEFRLTTAAQPEPEPIPAASHEAVKSEPKKVITTQAEQASNHSVSPVHETKPKPEPMPEPVVEAPPIPEPEPEQQTKTPEEKTVPEKPLESKPEPVADELVQPKVESVPDQKTEPVITPEPAVPQSTALKTPEPAITKPVVDEAALQEAYVQQQTLNLNSLLNSKAKYPPLAVKRNIEGAVKLAVIFDAQGRVADVQIEQSSGSSILDKEALKLTKKVLKKKIDITLVGETLRQEIVYRLQ